VQLIQIHTNTDYFLVAFCTWRLRYPNHRTMHLLDICWGRTLKFHALYGDLLTTALKPKQQLENEDGALLEVTRSATNTVSQ
jgi:hypothetical protein